MTAFTTLQSLTGTWQGTYSLQDPFSNLAVESASTARVTSILGGRFVRLDYTWEYETQPQEGSILFGYEGDSDKITAHWIDSWHMGDKVMVCRESDHDRTLISVLGGYAAPPGPDWGWRTTIEPTETPNGFRMTMYNITPDGQEELAIGVTYRKG
jgi:hypothetical protein